MLKNLLILFCVLVSISVVLGNHEEVHGLLYVWAGQDGSINNPADFVAVIDYDKDSNNYGKLINTVHLPNSQNTAKTGNEPHHCRLSNDRKYFVGGGLLSFASGIDEVFVFEIPEDNPEDPKFVYGIDPKGGCTDELVAVNDHEFIFTQMCSAEGGAPGEIIHLNARTGNFRTLTNTDEDSDLALFNPHGFGYHEQEGYILSVDYILPGSLLGDTADDLVFRNTVRHFEIDDDLQEAELVNTWEQETAYYEDLQLGTGNGFMDTKVIPNDGRAFICGTSDQQMYLIDPEKPDDVLKVFNLVTLSDRYSPSAGIIDLSKDGNRMLMTYQMRFVILWDITVKESPVALEVFDFCDDTFFTLPTQLGGGTYSNWCSNNGFFVGTHYIDFANEDDHRFIVTNYFLSFGLAQFPATKTIHSFTLNEDMTSFSIDRDFDPNQALADVGAIPHATQHIRTNEDGSVYSKDFGSSSSSASTIYFNAFFILFIFVFLYL